jgi:hypothetical protein
MVSSGVFWAAASFFMTRELPSFIVELLNAVPRAGDGVHDWLFRVSRQLHAHFRPHEIFQMLQERITNCGRTVPDTEIWDAIKNSMECAWQPGADCTPAQVVSKWPAVNQKQRAELIRDGGGLVDLWEESRIRIESNEPKTESIIDQLFPGNPLLCCGKSSTDFDTKPRDEWRGELSGLSLVVPSPMSSIEGVTKNSKPSKHTLSNTGGRRFLICEFDSGTVDEHATLLLHLASYAPLVCAVHSGGKSLHGWFFVQGQPEERILKFFRYAVSLGADSRLWTRSQFCRMPDGTRDNGNRQTVFFLNFRPLEVRK